MNAVSKRTLIFTAAFLFIAPLFALQSVSASVEASMSPTRVQVTMDSHKSNGKTWDILWGNPDPYVVVDGTSYRADRCNNTLTCTFTVRSSASMHIEVWDADVKTDDPAGSAFCLRGHTCSTSGATLKIY
jgi:hypothetical protein